MTIADSTVFLIDDDSSVLKATSRLLRAAGYKVAAFGSAEQFLATYSAQMRGCVVLDFAMPSVDGLELQRELLERGCDLPIIFLTGRADVPMSVCAMKQGAVDLLIKPADEATIIRAVQSAIEKDRENGQDRAIHAEVARRLATLTPREREVLELVVSGMLNKQVAADLGTVEKTIKVH